jgi:hypothetical protein
MLCESPVAQRQSARPLTEGCFENESDPSATFYYCWKDQSIIGAARGYRSNGFVLLSLNKDLDFILPSFEGRGRRLDPGHAHQTSSRKSNYLVDYVILRPVKLRTRANEVVHSSIRYDESLLVVTNQLKTFACR